VLIYLQLHEFDVKNYQLILRRNILVSLVINQHQWFTLMNNRAVFTAQKTEISSTSDTSDRRRRNDPRLDDRKKVNPD
jgi:hypothetical protein